MRAELHACGRVAAVRVLRRLRLVKGRAERSAGIAAVITALEPRDDLVRVRTDRLTALVPAALVAELRLAVGAPVTLTVPAAEVRIAPA